MGNGIDIIVDVDCCDVESPVGIDSFGNLKLFHVIVGTIVGLHEIRHFLEQIFFCVVVRLGDNSFEELIFFVGGIERGWVLLFTHEQVFVSIY